MSGSIWGILGVAPGSNRDTVRRAYAKKLRVTNPEDDPQGFMALRDAYESALEQLRWAAAEAAYDAEDVPEPAELPPGTAICTPDIPPPLPRSAALSPEIEAFVALRARDEADLIARQDALVTALTSAWAPDAAALMGLFNAVLAAPLLTEIAVRAGVEEWLAHVIASNLPRADPLVRPAVDHFGWEEQASHGRSHMIYAVLQRLEEGMFAGDAAQPHAPLHRGWQALTTPATADWRMRLSAFVPGRPAAVATILAAVDGGLPGIRDWFDAGAETWWRRHGARARINAVNLLLIPLFAAIAAVTGAALDWPSLVTALLAVAAFATPWLAVRLVEQPQRDWADAPWDRPEWYFTGWMAALAALPVIAQLVPVTLFGAIIMGLAALLAVGWATVALPLRRDLKPFEPIGGIISAAWPFGIFFSLGVALLPAAAIAIWSLMTLALVIGWWRGGDSIAEAIARHNLRYPIAVLVALVSVVTVLALVVGVQNDPVSQLVSVYLLVPPLGIMLFIANRLVPTGRSKLVLGIGWVIILFALFISIGRAAPVQTGTEKPPVVTAPVLAASGIGTLNTPGTTPVTPRNPVDGWLSVDDYAPAAFARPGLYTQMLDIDVGADGMVGNCRTTRRSGNDAIDIASCTAVTRRARFNPARGVDGAPIAGSFTMQIVWNVPSGVIASPTAAPPLFGAEPAKPGLAAPLKPRTPVNSWVLASDYPATAMADDRAYTIGFTLDIDATGKPEACRINASSGSAVVDRVTCDAARRRARFIPALDAAGMPVAGRYSATLSWSVVPAAVPAMPVSKPLAADRTAPDATLTAPPIGDSSAKPD